MTRVRGVRSRFVCMALVAPAFLVLGVFGASGVASGAVPKNSAKDVVSIALAKVMEVLEDVDAPSENRRERITEIAYAHFDFRTMSKLVVARPWRNFSKQQRAEFVPAFKTLLARSYGRRLERYQETRVEVVGEVVESRGDVTVQSQIVGGQFDGATMNYRMRSKTGEWLVIDVIIEGISLVSNFRDQFKPIVASGGAVELLRQVHEKNDRLLVEQLAQDDGRSTAEDGGTTAAK